MQASFKIVGLKDVLAAFDDLAEQIGDKSFVLRYELMVNDVLYAVGRSVQVCFDAHTQKTISIPAEMREMLKRIEE